MSVRTLGGKYELNREIGRGGMGSIWLALDRQLQRNVAVKLLSASTGSAKVSTRAREQFEREAMAVARLQHPHVVQIFDYGIDGDAPYIVMEHLEGETLAARLARMKTLSPAAVAQVLSQAAKALSAAHAAGIIHRDLKPANLYFARTGGEEILKILDFGVATMTGAGGALRGVLAGTPPYISPEQLRASRAVDHRTDLWSLAVVAYRALTGELPFTASSFGELAVKVCTDPLPLPSTKAPELPPDVDRFFLRALAKDAGQRFQSARELAAAFAEAADPAQARRAAKVLVVDDEPDAALMIRQLFRRPIREGAYEFVFAGDGEQALAELRAHPDVDVVLTDINMPVMDGLTLLGRVPEVNAQAKVIIVSAYSDMGNIRTAMNRGAFDFVVKPIEFADVLATLGKTVAVVRETRRTQRSTEENRALRMFVPPAVTERVLPALRAGGAFHEAGEASVAIVRAHGFASSLRASGASQAEGALRRLNANFEVILPELAARGGQVERCGGEEVIAVFRGPHHREQAVRACVAVRAQLRAIAERAGADSPYAHGVAAAVASGEVVAGAIGSQALSRFDYAVLGEPVATAAALSEAAARGEIRITDELRRALGDACHVEARGTQLLDGAEVAVWDVIAAAAAPGQEGVDSDSATRTTTRSLLEETVDARLHGAPAASASSD